MNTTQKCVEGEKVTLDSLSEMVGFSKDYIKKELLLDESETLEEISLSDLRKAMATYLDKTMLN